MKKIGILLFIAAVAVGVVLARMFSFGSIPSLNLPKISFNSGVRGSGNLVAEKRNVTGFTKVDASGAFQVEVVAGKEFSVEVQGDDNLLPLVSTAVDGETLEIKTTRRVSTSNRMKVVISAPEINEIIASGASSFTVSGIENESISLDTGGASRIKVSGTAKNVNIDMGGASKVDASALDAENVSVEGGGASYAKVKASAELTADMGGASRLSYLGEPKVVNKKTSGVANIKQAD